MAVWPYSVNISLSLLLFLATLRWPQDVVDLGKFCISYLELLIMFEQGAGHQVNLCKIIRLHLRARRPIVGTILPASIGDEIRRGCQFIHGLFRSTGHLRGDLATSVPCQPGAHFTGRIQLGWVQCGHDPSSRPRESGDMPVIHALEVFFRVP